jgi:predicted O-linked N-acetylglucosamine transferase (SPINDLY family)
LAEALHYAYSAHQAGQYSEAERVYRLVLRAQPKQFDALHLLGVLEAQRGRNDEAIRLLNRAINVNPRSADALSNRANILRDLKRYDEALDSLDRALAIKPNFPEALNNRGNVLHSLGRHVEALASYDQALSFRPDYPKALANRGDVLRELRRHDEALASCDRALAIAPDLAEAMNNRGNVLDELGRCEEALADYDRALAHKPDYESATVNRAQVLQKLGRHEEALRGCQQALHAKPQSPDLLNAQGDALRGLQRYEEALASYALAATIEPPDAQALSGRAEALLGLKRHEEALASCDQALQLEPSSPQAIYHRANVLRALNRSDEALANYAEAVSIKSDLAEAHLDFAQLLKDQGWRAQAIAHYERALSLRPDLAEARFALSVAELPIVYQDEAEISERRAAYESRLSALARGVEQGQIKGDLVAGLGSSSPFYLAYQGRDDRALRSLYGEMACRIMADRYPGAEPADPPRPDGPLRVGIVSGYFRRHTVWKLMLNGWLSQLDRSRFRLLGYYTGAERDAVTASAAARCERFVQGPLSIARWREEILADAPDVIVYPEVGMDGVSAQLAALRLAPLQCVSWGHPETTGMPTIDYFLSSDLMEPPGGETHYTERLMRLPNLSIYYEPAERPAAAIDRAALGISAGSVAYWCGQSLFKYLPQYDDVYPRIVREVTDAQFVFIEHHAGSEVTASFRKRIDDAFARFGMTGRDHYVFLPRLSEEGFIAATGLCDICLDSIGWSGGNTTLESLEYCLPIVTMGGPLMRGRHSAAILTRMGIGDTIAQSLDGYVAIAVRLGREAAWRSDLARAIAERKHIVYRDKECIVALERFLEQAARGGAPDAAARARVPNSTEG